MHLRSGKSLPNLTSAKSRPKMVRPPPNNQNNNIPSNSEGQPTQASNSNANVSSGVGHTNPAQTSGTMGTTVSSTVICQIGA
ncbi:hypothetical protein A2U01_0064085, partial [Trifolium medium]|nr:hypothetical protein [Trifolium medium]